MLPLSHLYSHSNHTLSSLQGSAYTSIEPEHDINKVCHLPNSGMVLMAQEDPKLLAYYIPVSGWEGSECNDIILY